jgi:hypothetical protein
LRQQRLEVSCSRNEEQFENGTHFTFARMNFRDDVAFLEEVAQKISHLSIPENSIVGDHGAGEQLGIPLGDVFSHDEKHVCQRLNIGGEQLVWLRYICGEMASAVVKIQVKDRVGSGFLALFGGQYTVFTNQHVVNVDGASINDVIIIAESGMSCSPSSLRFFGSEGLDFATFVMRKEDAVKICSRFIPVEVSNERVSCFFDQPYLETAGYRGSVPVAFVVIGHPFGGQKTVSVAFSPRANLSLFQYEKAATRKGSSGSVIFPLVPPISGLFTPSFAVGMHFASGLGIQLPSLFEAARRSSTGAVAGADSQEALIGFFIEGRRSDKPHGYDDVCVYPPVMRNILKDLQLKANDEEQNYFEMYHADGVDFHISLTGLDNSLHITLRLGTRNDRSGDHGAGKVHRAAYWYYVLVAKQAMDGPWSFKWIPKEKDNDSIGDNTAGAASAGPTSQQLKNMTDEEKESSAQHAQQNQFTRNALRAAVQKFNVTFNGAAWLRKIEERLSASCTVVEQKGRRIVQLM